MRAPRGARSGIAPAAAPRGAPRTPARRWAAPAVQLVALGVVAGTGVSAHTAASADLAADRGIGRVVTAPPPVRRVAPPVALHIPALDVRSRLVGLRKDRRGALGVPADAARAGWYAQGPAPGDVGPAVIAGHVDSYEGPGVFHRLHELKRGDEIRVRRADGTIARFAVTQVRTYAKRRFPTELVYRGDGRASLRLVTCGGSFDRRAGTYRSNTIVFAAPLGPRSAPAGRTS